MEEIENSVESLEWSERDTLDYIKDTIKTQLIDELEAYVEKTPENEKRWVSVTFETPKKTKLLFAIQINKKRSKRSIKRFYNGKTN